MMSSLLLFQSSRGLSQEEPRHQPVHLKKSAKKRRVTSQYPSYIHKLLIETMISQMGKHMEDEGDEGDEALFASWRNLVARK